MKKIKVNGQDVQIPENTEIEFKDGVLFLDGIEYKKEHKYPVIESCDNNGVCFSDSVLLYGRKENVLFCTFKALYFAAKKWNSMCNDKEEDNYVCIATDPANNKLNLFPGESLPLKFKTKALAEKFLNAHIAQLELVKELL